MPGRGRVLTSLCVLALLWAGWPAAAHAGIPVERRAPFDFARACVSVQAQETILASCESEDPAVALAAHADVGGTEWTRGSVVNPCPGCACLCPTPGAVAASEVGIALVVPASRTVVVQAHLRVLDDAFSEVCLAVGGAPRSCAQEGALGALELEAQVEAPPGGSLVADPAVTLRSPGAGVLGKLDALRAGDAQVQVERFVYWVS
jgi:hypothetical protein